MRLTLNALLALPALLSAYVVAVPSPSHLQQSLSTVDPPSIQHSSRWKSLSERLIETLWGLEKSPESRSSRPNGIASEPLSRQTLARYGNDIVLRFNISTAEEAKNLAEAADTLLLDVWDFTHNWVDIRLSRDIVPSLLGLLPLSLQHAHTPLLRDRDLAQAVYDTYSQSANGVEDSVFFQQYQPLSVIEPWMRFLSEIYATHVDLVTIGQSFDGRDILALRVGRHPTSSNPEQERRRTVLVTGGMHAREWISTSTVNYVAFNFISSYGMDDEITALLNEYDFVFVPTVNPDGYAYTWETDRLWRKNRQSTSVRFCRGVDLDHAFGFEWDSLTTTGSPCSESYAGESPFEAVEAKALADWVKRQKDEEGVDFVTFLDLHSYSQQILYPYSYSCDDTPPSQENLEELALGLEKAIRRASGFGYESMAACEGNNVVGATIEQSGGAALDWFYHEMHVKYAYQIKLRDRGTYGFLLPKENIVPVGKEILGAMRYLGEFLRNGYAEEMRDDGEGNTNGDDSNPKDAMDASENDEDEIRRKIEQDLVEKIVHEEDERRLDLRRLKRR